MDCKTARLLLDFARPLATELEAGDAEALHTHLADCTECALLARAERRLDDRLGQAMRDVPMPAELRSKLLLKLAAERRGWYRRRLVRGAAVAAALLLAVGLGWAWLGPKPRAVDLEQVSRNEIEYRGRVEEWYAERGHAVSAAPFNTALLGWYGLAEFEGALVPQLVFRRKSDDARVYVLDSRRFDLSYLLNQYPADSGGFTVKVIPDPGNARLVYLVIFTGGPEEWFRARPAPRA